MSEIKVNKVSPATGTAITLGDSGDTFTVPSGATIVNSGTATGFGGGKVLQVVTSSDVTDMHTSTSTSWVDITGLSVSITPSATSSKVLVVTQVAFGNDNSYPTFGQILRGSTAIGNGVATGNWQECGLFFTSSSTTHMHINTSVILDSPSTTSSTTYKVQWKNQDSAGSSATMTLNSSRSTSNSDWNPRTASRIMVMEIGA